MPEIEEKISEFLRSSADSLSDVRIREFFEALSGKNTKIR
jgi:hypothetical protein